VNLSPLSGMRAADLLLTTTADNTANADTPDYRAEQVDLATAPDGGVSASVSRADAPGVDLIEQMTNLSVASAVYTANARVLRAAMDNERTLLDVLA
jgi:flagellar hook-associated protein FlgK